MKYKAISSYPVFLITTMALLAITMLAITSMNNLEASLEEKPGQEMIEYHIIGGKLYIKTNIDPPIKEIIITNNGSLIINLDPYNEFYGPITLPDNASMILIIGESQRKPIILDVLRKPNSSDTFLLVNHEVLPPSIMIDASGNIIPINQYNATKTYRKLIPYTYRKGPIQLYNNTIYKADINGAIYPVGEANWISLGEYVNNTSDLTQIYREYIGRYGSIRINYTIPMTIYPYDRIIPLYDYKVLTYTSSKLPIRITYYNELGIVNTSKQIIAYVRIENTITSASLIDSLGRSYPVNLRIYYKLILAAEQGYTKTITNITLHNETSGFKDVFKPILLINETTKIILEIMYEINTPSPIYSTPLYATVSYILSGGYDQYTVTLYNPDTVIIGNTHSVTKWIPKQNTTLNLVLIGNLWYNTSKCIIQNMETTIYNINYILLQPIMNKTYDYTIEVYPSILIVKPDNINLEFNNITLLIARNLTGNTIFISSNSTLVNASIMVKPCIIVNETLILLDHRDKVYIFSDENNDKVIIASNRRITTINLGLNYSLVNFVIEETIQYRDPLILLKDTIRYNVNVTVRITVSFIDNSSVQIEADSTKAVDLGIDKPIIGLNVSINVSPCPRVVYYSMKTIILVDDNGMVHLPVEVVKTRIFGIEYYILVTPDKTYAYPA